MSVGYLQQMFTRNSLVNIAVWALDCQFLVSEFNPYQEQVKNPLPFTRHFSLVKMKAFEDDNFSVAQTVQFFFENAENIVGKGENAGYKHFFLQYFQKPSLPE